MDKKNSRDVFFYVRAYYFDPTTDISYTCVCKVNTNEYHNNEHIWQMVKKEMFAKHRIHGVDCWQITS